MNSPRKGCGSMGVSQGQKSSCTRPSETAFTLIDEPSESSVFVDEGDSMVVSVSVEDWGAGVPSRSRLVESLFELEDGPFLI